MWKLRIYMTHYYIYLYTLFLLSFFSIKSRLYPDTIMSAIIPRRRWRARKRAVVARHRAVRLCEPRTVEVEGRGRGHRRGHRRRGEEGEIVVETVRRLARRCRGDGGWRCGEEVSEGRERVRGVRRSLSRSLMPPVVTGSRVYRQSGSYFGA